MKNSTLLDAFGAALLCVLGSLHIVACGGTAVTGDKNSDAGSDAAGAAGSAATGNRFPCKNPVDLRNGIITCDDGLYHRASAIACASKVPRPDPYPDSAQQGSCKSDADCVLQPYGWCEAQPGRSDCRYGCITDSDCASNQLCECGDPVGRCVSTDCKTDADCGTGFLCSEYYCGGRAGFACQSSADTCGGEQDCAPGNADTPTFCSFDTEARRFECTSPSSCVD